MPWQHPVNCICPLRYGHIRDSCTPIYNSVFLVMDPNSQAYFVIPVSGYIQPQSESLDDNPSKQSVYPSFFPSLPSMRAGPSIPKSLVLSSGISEVLSEHDMSDDEMSMVVCTFFSHNARS